MVPLDLKACPSKSFSQCSVSQVSEWSLRNRKGLFCVACHASAYKGRFCHVLKCCSYVNTVPQLKPKLNNAEAKKPFYEFSFIKKSGGSFSENYY